jgi:membrane protein required for colicin V production
MPEIAIDSIFALILVVSLALGAWRGLFYEVLSLLSWIAAFMLSQLLATDLAQILPMGGAGEPIRFAAAFVVIFVIAAFAGGLLARMIQKLTAKAGLQSTDRALGALFGVLRGVILLLVLTAAVSMSQFKNSAWWKESTGVGIALAALQNLKPLLPEDVGKYLP